MLLFHFVVRVVSVGLMVLSAGAVSGQDYPSKPIRIVTTGAGGGSDFSARQAEIVASSPEQFAARIKSDIAKWTRVVRDSGIKKAD